MDGDRPRVSIGLPVYNGERYLAAAIEAVLAQTFVDFELIISDNASTDSTAAICRAFAARDPRVRYLRNPTNIGMRDNFRRVFHEARGELFKWMAHDDLFAPDFVRRCVEALDTDPSAVLAFTRFVRIDSDGAGIGPQRYSMSLTAAKPHERLRMRLLYPDVHQAQFGLIRREPLSRTGLFADYYGSDYVLLAELCLYGRFHEVPEILFFDREHTQRSSHAIATGRRHWGARGDGALVMLYWEYIADYLRALRTAPVGPLERARCFAELFRWWGRRFTHRVPDLLTEASAAARHLSRRAVRLT